MNYREKKIKEFREKFVYPGSLCGQEFLVGVTVKNLEAFLSETIEECRGFVPSEDPTGVGKNKR